MHYAKLDKSDRIYPIGNRFKDISGQQFGKLTALYPTGKQGRHILWKCKCKCGNFSDALGINLRAGNITSCGCNHCKGKNHYRYKNGLRSVRYRRLIRKEKCSQCESTNNLVIHHKDFDHFNNSLNNLEVLCNHCHLSLHAKTYYIAIRSGQKPPKSNGIVGWKKNLGCQC
jgi:hypothetical protein